MGLISHPVSRLCFSLCVFTDCLRLTEGFAACFPANLASGQILCCRGTPCYHKCVSTCYRQVLMCGAVAARQRILVDGFQF